MTTYKLAIFSDRFNVTAPCRVAIVSPGKTPAEVKWADEHGYDLVRVIDLNTNELPPLNTDELLLAPSDDISAVDVLGLVAKVPRADDAGLNQQHARETSEEMRHSLDEAYLDRTPQENSH